MLILVAALLGTAPATDHKIDKTAASPADSAQYAGSDTCETCHEEQFKNIDLTRHHQIDLLETAAVAGQTNRGCESCHGPGAAHVAAGGDKAKIFTFAGATPEQVSERCESCHRDNRDHQNFNLSSHYRNGVSCISCHSPHKSQERRALLTAKATDLCYSCHQSTKDEFEQPFHHRVNEGLVQCGDCHNVHGGKLDHQLRTSSAQDSACLKCHAEKRGPFVFEHPPVKTEGCSSCHTPHGSTNPRLLNVSRVNSLCLQCHTDIIAGPHPQNTRAQACTYCHTQIHGSNASSVYFK